MSVKMPVIIMMGQSNALVPPIDSRIVTRLDASGGAYEFDKVAQGGTSLFQTPGLDWNAGSQGELFHQMIEATLALIQNVRDQGGDPDVTLLFAQGEVDKQRNSAAYQQQLEDFIAAFRQEIGQDDAKVVLLLLPGANNVRSAMLRTAQADSGVFTIETAGLQNFDGVHYTDASATIIGDRFADIVDLNGPAIAGYHNLLDPGSTTVTATKTIVTGPEYLSFDFVDHSAANFQVTTSSGDDHITTGSGADYVQSGLGADVLDGGAGDDRLSSSRGDDKVFGRDGDDVILTSTGDDRAFGGNGNDYIDLGDQHDLGVGDAGDDTLIGGENADILWGGTGSDTFYYQTVLDSLPGRGNYDLIRDFEQGIDHIDLSSLGHLTFSDSGHFSGTESEVIFAVRDDRTYIKVDLDGDRIVDFVIQLSGQTALTADDFILG